VLRARALVLISFACCMASSVPSIARAEEKSTDPEAIIDAAREFEEGRRAYRAGDYAAAAAHFEAAHRAAPRADALRNAILARQKDKDLARAATLAAVAVTRYPEDTGLAQMAKQLLPSAEKRLFRVDLSCGAPCTIVADKKLAPWPDTSEAVLFFEPGAHEIAVTWGRKSRTTTVEGTSGKRTAVKLTPPEDKPAPVEPAPTPPEEAPEKPAEPKPPAWKLPPTAFYAFGATTLVFGGLAAYSGIEMRSDPGKDKVRADCAGRDRSCRTYQDALSAQRRTNVLLGVTAGAAIVTGIVGVFLTDWSGGAETTAARRLRQTDETAGVRVVPFVWHDGRQGSLGASGTF
jgi:hypothetical protein